MTDAIREIDRLDETLIRRLSIPHPSGLRVLAAPADAIEASYVDDSTFARILSLARRAFDYVVVDTFPVMDSVVVAILDLSDAAYVVVSGLVPNVTGAAHLLRTLDMVGCPESRQRLVLNETHPSFAGRLRAEEVAARLGRSIDFSVPFDKGLLVAANTGEPHAMRAKEWFGFGKALRAVVDDMEALPSPARNGADLGARRDDSEPAEARP